MKKEDKNKELEENLMSDEEIVEEMGTSMFEKQLTKNHIKVTPKQKKEFYSAYKKATNIVKVEIAFISAKITQKEVEIEEAKENIKNQLFNENFMLQNYDNAVNHLDNLEEQLEDLKYTLEKRQDLLVLWK